jgi:hypothetical protein
MRWFGFSLFSLTLLASPFAAHAAFSFTEIMFDAPGTDAKHEWVEVQNLGGAVDMSDFKFFEANSNHGLTLVAGSATVPGGGYAIIAGDATTFLADFPTFTGTLFDATFSLSNSGEALVLRDGSLTDVATASYTGDAGGAGDGNTLNFLNSVWVPRAPTPGSAATTASAPAPVSDPTPTATTTSPPTAAYTSSSPTPAPQPSISVDGGADRVVVVGAGVQFTAKGFGLSGGPLENARYVWSFGDAGTREGQSVMYAYALPGTYTVTVDASSAGRGATDRVVVTVVPADVFVTRASPSFIELHNRTSHELDLALWQLQVGTSTFVLPPYTIIGGNRAVAFPASVTNLHPDNPSSVTLRYPNGTQAAGPAPELSFVVQPSVTAPAQKTTQAIAKPKSPEPRVLGASTKETDKPTIVEQSRVVAAAIESPTEGVAWAAFGFLAALVVLGLGALAYLQLKQ